MKWIFLLIIVINIIISTPISALHILPKFNNDSELLALIDKIQSYKNLAVLKNHTAKVTSIAFSHNDSLMVSSGYDDTIILWKLPELIPLKSIRLSQDRINTIKFNPINNNIIAYSCREWDQYKNRFYYKIILYDISTGEVKVSIPAHQSEIVAIDFSPDANYIISGSRDATIKLWDSSTGKEIYKFKTDKDNITSLVFSPKGKSFAVGSNDKTIAIWDINKRQRISLLTGHTMGITSIIYDHDGERLISASEDNSIRIWNLNDPAYPHTIFKMNMENIYSISLNPDGTILASTEQIWDENLIKYIYIVKLWELSSGKELAILGNHNERINILAYSRNGRMLASGSNDSTIKIWDTTHDLRRFFINDYEVDWSAGTDLDVPNLTPEVKVIKENTPYDNQILIEIALRNNNSKGNAYRVFAMAESKEASFNNKIAFFGMIKPGEYKKRILPFYISNFTPTGKYEVTFSFDEQNGLEPEDKTIDINVKALARPSFSISYSIIDNNDNRLKDSRDNKYRRINKGETVDLSISIQNIGTKDAEDIKISLPYTPEGLMLHSPWEQVVKSVPKGKSISIILNLTRTTATDNKLNISIQEKGFGVSQEYSILLPFN